MSEDVPKASPEHLDGPFAVKPGRFASKVTTFPAHNPKPLDEKSQQAHTHKAADPFAGIILPADGDEPVPAVTKKTKEPESAEP